MATSNDVDLVFKALADPTRRSILRSLEGRRLAVSEVATQYPDMSRPAISKHLRILREAGLVSERQQGRQRLYGLVEGCLGEAREWLAAVDSAAPGRQAAGKLRERQVGSPRGKPPAAPEWKVW